jgi:4-hydroxy-tetrahydrodipicolinate synthase
MAITTTPMAFAAHTMSSKLTGVLAPVLTPFDSNLRPDFSRFVQIGRWLVEQGCGLAMFGTNSEGNSLAVEERIDLLAAAVDAGLPPHMMLPGTGSCALTDTVRLTEAATRAGCAGVLMLPPFYYKTVTDDGLFSFFAEVIERVGDEALRIYLYHIPPVAAVGISHDLIERLLKRYPKVIAGIKDTGGDWQYTVETIRRFSGNGFDVFAGTESILLDTMRAGGVGCISATANVNPASIVQLFDSWQGSDAQLQQESLNAIRRCFTQFPLVAAMKSAVSLAASDPDWARTRPPLQPLDERQRTTLHAALREMKFKMGGFATLTTS